MTVQQIIDMAKAGELKNLVLDTDTILAALNLGIIELYKRFPLRVEEAIVTLGNKEYYKMDGTDPDVDMPTDAPYMWIVRAYGEVPMDCGVSVNELPINDEDNLLSINTVNWCTIQVPAGIDNETISLIYVAAPVLLTAGDLNKTLPIPPQLYEALLHYVGYRAHGALDGNIQAENSTHYQRFEASCQRAKESGMYTTDSMEMDRDMKGFV